ncbi:MAG: hypothetical protein PHC51_08380 [bacterium]|nr:hypothetical protein [bacterium]
MSEVINSFILSRAVSGSLAEFLSALSGDDEIAVDSIIVSLQPSANTLRDYLRMLEDITVRDRLSLGDIVRQPQLAALLEGDASAGRKDRQGRFKRELELLRYPERSRLLQDVQSLQRQIASRYGFRVEVPEMLEGDSVKIQFSARSTEEMEKAALKLADLSRSEELSQLYQLLLGI